MRPLEKSIVHAIRRALILRPRCVAYKMHGSPYSTAGMPDLLVIDDGRTIWLEVKRPGRPLTAIQAARHAEMRGAGAVVDVVHNADEAVAVLESQKHLACA